MSTETLPGGQTEFAAWLARTLVIEGGKVDDKRDPGGRTNKGVTQRVYNGWRRAKGLPIRDVWQIGDDEVAAIYRVQYWDRICGDRLPVGLASVVADGAVNSGVDRSARWLQAALGVHVDGLIGEATIAAALGCVDVDRLIARICALRLAFCQRLATWRTFGRGWTARIAQVQAAGQAIAMGSVGPQPAYAIGGERKALLEDARPAAPASLGDATGSGGVVTATVAQVQAALTPAATIEWIGHILTAITVIGGLATAVGFAYSAWARRHNAARAAALMIDQRPRAADPVPVNDNAPADAGAGEAVPAAAPAAA